MLLSDVPHFSGAIWPPILLWSGWVRVARGGDAEFVKANEASVSLGG